MTGQIARTPAGECIPMTGCNGTGGIFSTGPGLVTFGNVTNTDRNVGSTTIFGNGINQVWSAHVLASNCNKVAFAGGAIGNFNSDCRRSHATDRFFTENGRPTGDFFSWCAVMHFRDTLCPYPWRVPTQQDFIDLSIALSGSGNNENNPALRDRLIANSGVPGQFWGGAYGGNCNSNGALANQGTWGFYWSQTELPVTILVTNAWVLNFGTGGPVNPQHSVSKNYGLALRCVRDVICDLIVLTSDTATLNQTVGLGQIIAPVSVNLVSGVGGTATTTAIQWQRIDTISAGVFDTVSATQPAGLSFNGTTHTLTGSPTVTGRFIFTVVTVDHDLTNCDQARLSGTLTVEDIWMSGCNNDAPLFGESLGTISWGTLGNTNIETGTTVIHGTGGRTGQVWSGHVFAQNCLKTTYDGGDRPALNFNADCRRGQTDLTGHLFSWCAVMRFADVLCPDGWRVPTRQDFINLDMNMGGTGDACLATSSTPEEDCPRWHYYIIYGSSSLTSPQIGGTWNGAAWTGAALNNTIEFTTLTGYWSITERDARDETVYALVLQSGLGIMPSSHGLKDWGLSLRCVRDIPVCTTPGFTATLTGLGVGTVQTRTEGDCAPFPTLAVTAIPAAGATFRWFYNTVQSTTTGTPTVIPGATNNTFIPLRNTVGTRFYFAEVFFPGCGTVTTQVSAAHIVHPFVPVNPAAHCNMASTNWDNNNSIGTASFVTNTIWPISGNGITQEWSDAVRTTVCSGRTEFTAGGSAGNWNADCRDASGSGANNFQGNYFTWCAVMRFADVLCPPTQGWRVPTCADFVDLDIALGGTGSWRSGDPATFGYTGTVVGTTGGTWGGARWTGDAISQSGQSSNYWSQTPWGDGGNAHLLRFIPSQVTPQPMFLMHNGFAVRCVRNSPPPVCVDPNFTATVSGQGWTSTQSRQEGACAPFPTLTITASPAAGATFQWFYNTVQSTTTGTPTAIPGAINNTFIPLRDTIGERFYFAIVHFPGCGIRTTQVSAAHTVTGLGIIDLAAAGCNLNQPGWGSNTLTAGFATLNTWHISGNGIIQEWSDAVTATECAPLNRLPNGGVIGNWNADCRNSQGNANFGGHYFTWCAVARFADILCPPAQGWRVPTCADFVDLDIALGGNGQNRGAGENTPLGIVTLGYVGTSAANSPQSRWGGARFTGWAFNQAGAWSYYWSQTPFGDGTGAHSLLFGAAGVNPQLADGKGNGFAVRCVR